MKQTILTLQQCLDLHEELTAEDGLLTLRTSLLFKYALDQLLQQLQLILEEAGSYQVALMERLGTPDEEGGFILKADSPRLTEFQDEMNHKLAEKHLVSYASLSLADLEGVLTARSFPVFFQLVGQLLPLA